MLEQLRSAGEILRTSIDNYLDACSVLDDCLVQGKKLPEETLAYLEHEFELILPYEQKIRQARVAIGRAKNYCTSVSPISKLPSEILSFIFRLVSTNSNHRPCCLPPSEDADYYPNHAQNLDWLTHVCSRWRTIALSAPSLWTHIELTSHPLLGQGIVDRAHAYVNRVGRTPCKIYIDDFWCADAVYHHVDEIISQLASRTETLEFVITANELQSHHAEVLQSLISGCNLKTFKTLCVRSDAYLVDQFIDIQGYNFTQGEGDDGSDKNMSPTPNVLQSTESTIDISLAGLAVLHLQGVFFAWSSKLYYGLVDLRLICPPAGSVPIIRHFELVSILSGCPGLKILHFSLALFMRKDLDAHPMLPNQVFLPDLEEVYVRTTPLIDDDYISFHPGVLLRFLAPGSKPLRVTLEAVNKEDNPFFDSKHTLQFFARSNVEKLWLRKDVPSMKAVDLQHLPNLKLLVFDSCRNWYHDSDGVTLGSCTWVIHDTIIKEQDIRWMVESCPAKLVFSGHTVPTDGTHPSTQAIQEAFPAAQFLEKSLWLERAPDWDIVDQYVLSKY